MDAVHNLICALRDSIAQSEALIEELTRIADNIPAGTDADFAGGLRTLVRHYRARVVEQQDQLVALQKRYGDARSQG